MNVHIVIDETELQKLVCAAIAEKTNQTVLPQDVVIMVKSKQNYKSEWERASFKAEFHKDI